MWSGFYLRFNAFKLQSISPEHWRGLSSFHSTCHLQTENSCVPVAVGEWLPRHLIHQQAANAQHEVRTETGQPGPAKPNTEETVRAKPRSHIPLKVAAFGPVWKAGSHKAAPEGLISMERPIKSPTIQPAGPSALPWSHKPGYEQLGSQEGRGLLWRKATSQPPAGQKVMQTPLGKRRLRRLAG